MWDIFKKQTQYELFEIAEIFFLFNYLMREN